MGSDLPVDSPFDEYPDSPEGINGQNSLDDVDTNDPVVDTDPGEMDDGEEGVVG